MRSLYQQIDLDMDGIITAHDLRVFLEKNGTFKASHVDIRGLALKMGGMKNNRGKKNLLITFNDFAEEFQVKLP